MTKAERKARTIKDIEHICIRLFARQGIEHTTLDDIAHKAKLTKGAIYWHYASKEALVVSVLERSRSMWMSVIPAGIDASADPCERLHRLFSNYLTFITKHPDLTLFHQRVRLETKASIRKLLREFHRRSARFIEEILQYGEKKGVFRRLNDTGLYSFHILGALAGAHAQWLSDPDLDLTLLMREVETDAFVRLTGKLPRWEIQKLCA